MRADVDYGVELSVLIAAIGRVLREQLLRLAREKPRYGYRRLQVLVEREGERVNHKRAMAGIPRSGVVPEEEEAQALRARRIAAARVELRQPGVGAGFRSRCACRRSQHPRAERSRCVHAGVPGAGSGYRLRQPESDASAGRDHRHARAAAGNSLRQRPGADQPSFPGLGSRVEDRAAPYPAGQAHAERACGELPRQAEGGVPAGQLVHEPVRWTQENYSLEDETQRTTAT